MKQNKINIQDQEKNFLIDETDDIRRKYKQLTNKNQLLDDKESSNTIRNSYSNANNYTINQSESKSMKPKLGNTIPANVSIAPKYSQNAEKLKAIEDRMMSIEVTILLKSFYFI